MCGVLSVDLKYLFTSFLCSKSQTTIRSLIHTFLPTLIMEKFTIAQRVEIVTKFMANRRCMSDTFNALKTRGITTATEQDILNLMACLEKTGGIRDCDFQTLKKRKGIEDNTDVLDQAETQHPENSKITKLSSSFTEDEGYVVVYTDGACENKGKPNAKAGIGVWFGDNHSLNVSRPVKGRATNNTAEIQACVVALEILHQEGIQRVRLKTDSQFTINCITQWIKKWKKNNWKLASGGDVKNKEDLIKLDNIQNKIKEVDWVHIRGHRGEKGNEEADKLARNGAVSYKK